MNKITKKIQGLSTWQINIFLLCLGLIITIYLNWSFKTIAAFLFLVWFILNPQNSRFLSKIVVLFLVLTLTTVVIGRELKGEEMAVAAFAFLGLAVLVGIYENIKVKNKFPFIFAKDSDRED